MKKTNGLIRSLGSLVLIASGAFGGFFSQLKQEESELAVYHFEQILFHDENWKRNKIKHDKHLNHEQVRFCKNQLVMEIDNVEFYRHLNNFSFYAFGAGAIGICSFRNNGFSEQYWNDIRERLPSLNVLPIKKDWTHDPVNPYINFGKK